ncbi:MAG TPA: tetratricopeptide repeat protein, partial [Aggregatilineales bacterium]|nr:tetratricopeptide repeat protein [Aggregatilineales bacterium]
MVTLGQEAQQQLDKLTTAQRQLFYASGVFASDADFSVEALVEAGGGAAADVHGLTPYLLKQTELGFRHIDSATHQIALNGLGENARDFHLRHREYYRKHCDHWLIKPYDPEKLAAEARQFHHAVEWARIHTEEEFLGFVVVGCQHLSQHSVHQETVRVWLDIALALVDSHQITWGQAGPMRALGDVCVRVQHLQAARSLYYHALQRYGEESLAGQAHTFKGLGDLSVQEHDMQAARDFYYKALVLYEVVEFKLGQANALKQLAPLHAAIREYATAHDYYQRAITLYANMNFELEQANSLKELADLYAEQEDFDNARQYYDAAYELFGSIEFWVEQADTLLAMGNMYMRAMEPKKAAEYFQQAMPIYDRTGERRGKANTFRALGNLYLMESELDAASEFFRRAQEIYHQVEASGEAA